MQGTHISAHAEITLKAQQRKPQYLCKCSIRLKQWKNTMNTHTSIMEQGCYKNAIEFISGWPSTAGHVFCPSEWFLYLLRLHWKEFFFASTHTLDRASLGIGVYIIHVFNPSTWEAWSDESLQIPCQPCLHSELLSI